MRARRELPYSLVAAILCFIIAGMLWASMTFGRPITSMNAATVARNAALTQRILRKPATAASSAQVHLCPPNLCNGSTVISHPQPPGTKVLEFKVYGDKVLYTSNSSCRRELYSVLASVGFPLQISSMTMHDVQDKCHRNVTPEFSLSPDGTRAVYEADGDDLPTRRELGDQDIFLYSTSVIGESQVRLHAVLPADYDVERHEISCDSRRVVFRRGKDSDNKWELWSARIDVPNSAERISQVMGMSQAVGDFKVRCDGTVRFLADLTQSGNYKAYMTTVQPGGRIVEEVFADGFETGNTGGWR